MKDQLKLDLALIEKWLRDEKENVLKKVIDLQPIITASTLNSQPMNLITAEEARIRIEELETLAKLKIKVAKGGSKEGATSSAYNSLKFNSRSGEVEYVSTNGETKTGTFTQGNNEYSILLYLIDNFHNSFSSGQLVDCLVKEPRQHSNPNPKKRVVDVIGVIRYKLGKEVIKTTGGGYQISCLVTKI